MDFGIVGVASITVICYLIGLGIKTSKLDEKYIPVICGTVGAIMGVVAYLVKMPDFPANDPINAIAIGIVSGLAATGANQIYKQLKG
jgi:hypothetical protein